MTESRNGTKPPTGERGIALPEHISAYHGLPYQLGKWGIEDTSRPTLRELEDMLSTDAMVQAVERAMTLPISSVTPRVEGEGKEAKLVRENLLSSEREGGMTTPLSTVIDQMASAITLRRSFHEKVWESEGGRTRLKKLKFLPASTCNVVPDSRGNYDGFIQRGTQHVVSGSQGVRFKPDKGVTHFNQGGRAPLEGKSALQAAYYTWQDKKKNQHLLHLNLQYHSLGIRKGSTESANEEDQRSLLSRMEKVAGGGSLVLGSGESVEVMTGSSTADFTNYLHWLDRQIAVSTLAQFLQLGGSEGTGAQALSRDHSEFFTQALDSILRDIGDTITSFVIAPLVRYNFGPQAKIPTLKLGPISENDVQVALDIFKTLATAPASRVSDDVYQKIQEKALQSMDIEADKDTDTAPAQQAPQQSPQQPSNDSEDGDELERARRIVRGS